MREKRPTNKLKKGHTNRIKKERKKEERKKERKKSRNEKERNAAGSRTDSFENRLRHGRYIE
jgi:hypothetical protein